MINQGRIQTYLDTLLRETGALREALTLSDEKIQAMPLVLRGVKYSMIVIAEVIAEICQHILAKQHKTAVSGFGETLAKAASFGILSNELYTRLAPFLRFRNMLVHGYWKVDDALFLSSLRNGIGDFGEFAECIRRGFVVGSPSIEPPPPSESPHN